MTQEQSVNEQKIAWTAAVPIFRNNVIVRQLGVAIGIPFGVLILFLYFSGSGQSRRYSLYAIAMVAALLFLTWLLVMVLYGGKYEVGFVMDSRGVLCVSLPRQAKKNKAVNSAAIVLGLMSGNFTAAGAGVLAQSRQKEFTWWSKVRRVRAYRRTLTIVIISSAMQKTALFCTQENYQEVISFLQNRLGNKVPIEGSMENE